MLPEVKACSEKQLQVTAFSWALLSPRQCHRCVYFLSRLCRRSLPPIRCAWTFSSVICILAFLVYTASSVTSARAQSNLLLLLSQPGDYIGQGQTYFTTDATTFDARYYPFGPKQDILVTGFGYFMLFGGVGSTNLSVGTYSSASRFPFSESFPELDIFGNGRGCDDVCGSFQIFELHTDGDGNLDRLWMTFTQHCECSMAPLSGEVRFNSLLAPTMPVARTLRVPADYPTIQSALNEASFLPLDTVLVAPGVYNESVSFGGKRISLLSEEGPSKTFITAPGAVAVAFANGESSDARMSGFTITNSVTGVAVSRGGLPTIVSNIIVNCETGIDCNSGSSDIAASPLIRGNTIMGCTGGALGLVFTGSPIIEGNLIQWNGAGIGMWQAGAPIIRDNIIRNNQGNAMSMANQCDANIVQNLIVGNTGYGIFWQTPWDSRGPWLINNTICGNAFPGIAAYGGTASLMVNNIVVGSPALEGTLTDIRFNNFFPASESTAGIIGTSGNISADPLFACSAEGDYRIVKESPCIDAGSPDMEMLPPTDIGGNARIVAAGTNSALAVDLGAYEFDPAVRVPSCPTVSAPAALTAECTSPATIIARVKDADGDPLTVVWTLNGTPAQTNSVASDASKNGASLSYTAEMPLGTNQLVICVTDHISSGTSFTTIVTVQDTAPPGVLCSTNIIVQFTGAAGARVLFVATAMDDCSERTKVTCAPPSGSIFAVGTNIVVCAAIDNAGNQTQCSFKVTVLGALGATSVLIRELEAIELARPARYSLVRGKVIAPLRRSIDPKNWSDEMHLNHDQADRVFLSQADAVRHLQSLKKPQWDGISDEIIQQWIDRLVLVNRTLADLKIREAIKRGIAQKDIALASRDFERGNVLANQQRSATAILSYRDAWKAANRVSR
jgi:Right handed beta helix region/HYR domain